MYKVVISIIAFSILTVTASARPRRDHDFLRDNGKQIKYNFEKVKWLGYVEADGSHTTKHYHDLDFVRKSDGESFDIIDSPELEKIHCSSSKRLLVEIEAERTPKVLFWGNNLIVKKFTVLEELEELPHKKHVEHHRRLNRRDR